MSRGHPDVHFVLIGSGPLQGLVDRELERSRIGARFHQLRSRDVVEHGVSGLLVPPEDPYDLAGAIGRVLADSALRRSLVSAAKDRLEARFDVRAMGQALGDLYRRLVASRAGR